MTEDDRRGLWVAYGPAGAVGNIRRGDEGFSVVMVGAEEPVGTYPSLEIAKSALTAHLRPGADRPDFREH